MAHRLPRQPCPRTPVPAAGAIAALLLGINVALTYQDKLRQFLADVAGDQSGGGLAAAVEKVE